MPSTTLPRPLAQLLLLAIGLALSLLPAPLLANAAGGLYQRTDANVVCIHTTRNNGSVLLGTGFFVQGDVVATVAHQVRDASAVRVFLPDDRSTKAIILAVDPPHDTALLRVPATDRPGLPLAGDDKVLLGDEVFTIGCPMELSHSLSRGVISNPARRLNGMTLIQTDLAVNSGNSGGPLLDAKGRVIGLIMGSWKNGVGLNFAVKTRYLTDLMQQAEVTAAPATAARAGDPDLAAAIEQALKLGNPLLRLERLRQLAREHPTAAEAHHRLGLLYYQMGRFHNAEQALTQALSLAPDHHRALTALGGTLFKLDRHQEAKSRLLQAMAIDAEHADTYLNLGRVYAHGLHNDASARQAFLKYLELAPDGAQAGEIRAWLKIER